VFCLFFLNTDGPQNAARGAPLSAEKGPERQKLI
jgi:hypothetical protein